jgi:arsenite transporter
MALNDAIMVFAFGPIVGLASIVAPWETLFLSVVLWCIVVPLIVAQVIRGAVLKRQGAAGLQRLLDVLGPTALVALLTTLVLLFERPGD